MHINITFNLSISVTMIDAVKCGMRNYQNSDDLQFNIRKMNVACLFSLGPTAKDYLKAGISAKFQPFRETKVKPARSSYRVCNHAVHK